MQNFCMCVSGGKLGALRLWGQAHRLPQNTPLGFAAFRRRAALCALKWPAQPTKNPGLPATSLIDFRWNTAANM